MTEMVSVPRDLLAKVLNTAESDSYSTEAEFACAEDDHKRYAEERALVRQLREIAGIQPDGVVGQGFFGMALALKEQEDDTTPESER